MAVGPGRYVLDHVEAAGANVVRFYLTVPLPSAFTSWLTAIPILPRHRLGQISLLVDSANTVERSIAGFLREDFGAIGIRVLVEQVPFSELHFRVFESPEPKFDAKLLTFRDAQLYPALHLSVVFLHLEEPTHFYRRSDASVPASELRNCSPSRAVTAWNPAPIVGWQSNSKCSAWRVRISR
ncbi:MAG: hypothetical protein ACRDGN_10370 [bacterium]